MKTFFDRAQLLGLPSATCLFCLHSHALESQ